MKMTLSAERLITFRHELGENDQELIFITCDVISSDVMIMGKTDHGQLPIYHILFSHSDLLERVPFEAPYRLPSIWKPNSAFEA